MLKKQIDHIETLRKKYYDEVEKLLEPEYEKLKKMEKSYKNHCISIFDRKDMTERSYRVLIRKTYDFVTVQCIYEGFIPLSFEAYKDIKIVDDYIKLTLYLGETEYDLDKNYWVTNWVYDNAKNESHNGDFEKIIDYIL